jgi:PAS domain S-box-containing protein
MDPRTSLFLGLRITSGVVAIVLIYLLWKRRHSEGVISLMLFELFALIWVISDAFEGISTLLSQKIFWAKIAYIGITISPVFYLMFTLIYAQQKRVVNRLFFSFLLIIPILTLLLAFTNSAHGLIWRKISLDGDTGRAVYQYGTWFWIFAVYEYILLTLGIIHLFTGLYKFYIYYRAQIILLIIGSILPIVSNILYVLKVIPLQGVDLTPITFILSGFFIWLAIFWFKLFDIMPLARKQAFDILDDGLLVVDTSNRIIDANPVFSRLCGLSMDNLMGSLVENVFQLLDIDRNLPIEKQFRFEIKLQIDNEVRFFEVRGFPVYYKKSKLIGEILVFHEITLLKESLNRISGINRQLSNSISEKEKSIFELDAYAGTVAHDLKNPMGVILGYSELIEDNSNHWSIEKTTKLVGIIKKEAYKANAIIESLLLLSRLPREEFILVPVNMHNIIEESLERFYRFVDIDQVSVDNPKTWPVVLGHPQCLEEIWINLLSNAWKYGGKPLIVHLGHEKLDDSYFEFFVQDNGDGLPERSLEKLFKDFERLGAENIEGHGLGLSIVKRLVEKMGGKVSVTSKNLPGEGCIFSFTLQANK